MIGAYGGLFSWVLYTFHVTGWELSPGMLLGLPLPLLAGALVTPIVALPLILLGVPAMRMARRESVSEIGLLGVLAGAAIAGMLTVGTAAIIVLSGGMLEDFTARLESAVIFQAPFALWATLAYWRAIVTHPDWVDFETAPDS